MNKQTTIDKADSDKLNKYLEEINKLKSEMSRVEVKLDKFGVDPKQQFGYKSESDSYSDYSGYSSDTSLKEKDYSSDNSGARPKKRVKHLNPKDNIDMALVFPI